MKYFTGKESLMLAMLLAAASLSVWAMAHRIDAILQRQYYTSCRVDGGSYDTCHAVATSRDPVMFIHCINNHMSIDQCHAIIDENK